MDFFQQKRIGYGTYITAQNDSYTDLSSLQTDVMIRCLSTGILSYSVSQERESVGICVPDVYTGIIHTYGQYVLLHYAQCQ